MDVVDDERALVALCEALHPQLVGTLTVACGSRAVAEELTQETLLRVWTHWPRVRTLASPAGWAYRVALNLSRSWWRRRLVERRVAATLQRDLAAQAVVAGPDPTGVTIRAAVAALPARQREAIALRYFADLSIEDAAAAMRCAPGTVKNLTTKARETLRATLADAQEVTRGA